LVAQLTCADCGERAVRTGQSQKYCHTCSEARDLKRKRLWARRNPPAAEQAKRKLSQQHFRIERAKEAGHSASTDAASKNHIYTKRRNGHVALRRESKQIRQAITNALRAGLHCMPVVHNKVWIDILVQKPNHKGDAVNVVDLVCDAVKDAIDRVDDRWFCIRRLDWQIVKGDPRLFVGVGQDSEEDCQVCSYCGQIKPLTEFNASRNQPLGVGRECKACRRAGRLLAKQENN